MQSKLASVIPLLLVQGAVYFIFKERYSEDKFIYSIIWIHMLIALNYLIILKYAFVLKNNKSKESNKSGFMPSIIGMTSIYSIWSGTIAMINISTISIAILDNYHTAMQLVIAAIYLCLISIISFVSDLNKD